MYEFNVSLNGHHIFVTKGTSCTTFEAAQEMFEILEPRFPKDEGWAITCSRIETGGVIIPQFTNCDLYKH